LIKIDPTQSTIQIKSTLSGKEQVKLLFRLLKYALPIWDKILLRSLVLQFYALASVVPTIIGAHIIDEVLLRGTAEQLVRYVVLLIAIQALMLLLHFIAQIIVEYLTLRVANDMKWRFYKHLQRLSLNFFGKRPVGEHMFRSLDDIDGCAWIVGQMINDFLWPIQNLFAWGLVLATIDSWMIAISIIYVTILFLGRQWFVTRLRIWEFKIRNHAQRLDAILRQSLKAVPITKAFGRNSTVRYWYNTQLFKLVRSTFNQRIFSGWEIFFVDYSYHVFLMLVSVPVGLKIMQGEMTIGDYYIVLAVFPALTNPIKGLINVIQTARLQLVPAERMLNTLETPVDIVDSSNATKIISPKGHIKMDSINFSYEKILTIDNVSIEAKPGEKVALVGQSGSGKSTLGKLLLRLYDVNSGSITIDGVDIRDITQNSLRQEIGAVMQDDFLFAETLRENIRYGRRGATEEEILDAAAMAKVDEFINSLPQGYDTILSEGGNLSGGQRQRVCLARVLLRGSNILLLDEATSALDPLSEHTIISTVDNVFSSCTRIIIAHNLTAISDADRIYVLDEGSVVEFGKHSELMNKKGFYYRLWIDDKKNQRIIK